MTDICPVCGRDQYTFVELRDGGALAYEMSHLRCVRAMQADRDRCRDLFREANAAKRAQRALRIDISDAEWWQFTQVQRLLDLFKRANAVKRRQIRSTQMWMEDCRVTRLELDAERAKRCGTCGQRQTEQQDPYDAFYCGRHGWIIPLRDDPPMGCTRWEPRHD